MKTILVDRVVIDLLFNRNTALVARREDQSQLRLGEVLRARRGFKSCLVIVTAIDSATSSDEKTVYSIQAFRDRARVTTE